MWIKLKGANFSTNNIGTLTSYKINTAGLVGLTVNPKYVSYTNEQKSQTKEFIITPLSGYVLKANNIITCTHTDDNTTNSHTVTEDEVTAGKVTWTITLDSDIAFVGAAEKVVTPDPEEPVNYTFTLTPDPISATVTLSATGYSTVSGTGSKSITVADGTVVNWSVSADGYTTRTGNWTISGGNKTESIALTASGGGGGGNADYVSYLGTAAFTDIGQRVQWNESGQKWTDTNSGTTSAGTDFISVSSEDSIWISKIAVVNSSLASGAFYDMNKQLVAPLFWGTFGIDQAANASAKFVTPENPVTVASVEEAYNCSIAYVKFTAWAAADVDSTGIETTEARVYYANGVPQEPTYTSYIGEDVFSFNKETFTDSGYTTSGSSSAYASDYLAITPEQGVWLQYIFTMSDAHRCIGLFDSNKTFIKSITAADFGLSTSGKFQTPSASVKISDLEGTENVAYVRFVAWTTSDGGRANTEARIYSY